MPPQRSSVLVAGLHLTVLWAFAVVQPLLQLLGDAPEFFVARQNTAGDIVVLTIVLLLGPPAVLTVLEAGVRQASQRAADVLHLTVVGLLAAAFVLQALADVRRGPALALMLVALAFGVGAAVAYARTKLVRSLLSVLAPVPLVFGFLFLVVSPTSDLVFRGDEAAATDVAVPGRTPVVIIVFDEFAGLSLMDRRGRIDRRRLPAFARLAGEATWYPNATSVADFTDRAVTALLTGRRPEPGSAPTAADHPKSLFTLLGRSHDFDVVEPVTDICPQKLCPDEARRRPSAGRRLDDLRSDLSVVFLHLLLPEALRDDLPPIDRSFGDFADQDTGGTDEATSAQGDSVRALGAFDALLNRRRQFRDFVRRLVRPTRRPGLSFLHVELPHFPYEYLPDGRRYPVTVESLPGLAHRPDVMGGIWGADPGRVMGAEQRYLWQVGFADRLLGDALDRLRATGRYDESLVVVMADHGVSNQRGTPHRAVTAANAPRIAGIPLFIKAPRQQRGRVDRSNVRSIDVLPTVASLLGVRLPWQLDGVVAGRAGDEPVRVQAAGKPDVTLGFRAFVRGRDAAVRRIAADFTLGRRLPIPRTGADRDLVGRAVAALPRAGVAADRFELDDPGVFRDVDPAASPPVLVSGRLAAGAAAARLAVAVNGRIAANVQTYEDDGDQHFAALVPPEALSPGANRIAMIRVTGRGDGRRFERLRSADLDPRLVREGGREVLVDGSGRRLPVGPGVGGHVDTTNRLGDVFKLEGWAGDPRRRRPAGEVIAFAGSRFVVAARPRGPRSDLSRRYGPGLANAGFTLSGTAPAEEGGASARLRVFAVLDGRASPLPGVEAP